MNANPEVMRALALDLLKAWGSRPMAKALDVRLVFRRAGMDEVHGLAMLEQMKVIGRLTGGLLMRGPNWAALESLTK